jgi:SAM-dependent methyltransferase
MLNPKSTFRLGYSDVFDTLATWYHLHCSNAKKQLSQPSRLWIGEFIDLEDDFRIIEIGPSTGVTTASLLGSLGTDLTLFDIWTYVRQWSILERHNPRVKFVLGDADVAFPFPDGHFEMCVFMGAIAYMTKPRDTLKEVARILKPGSYLFTSSTKTKENNCNTDLGMFDSSIPTQMDGPEFKSMLEGAGFDVIRQHDYGAYPARLTKAFKHLNKFQYFSGPLYRAILKRYPERYVFTGAVARKR